MKLNRDYFYCFGCGAAGDATEFVARLFGLSPYEAAQKIAADFGLDANRPPTKSVIVELNRRRNAQARKENERLCVSVLTDYLWQLRDWKCQYTPQSPDELPDDRYVEACHQLDYVEYLLDGLLQDGQDERREIVTMLMKDTKIQNLQSRLLRLRKENEHDDERERA